MLDEMERTERQWFAQQYRVRDEALWLSGAFDGDNLDGPSSVTEDARHRAIECVRVHLMRVADAAYDTATAPFEADGHAANMTHIFGAHYGLTPDEARAINRCIDAVGLPVAARAARREDARLRRLGRVWERYTLARLRGKYMLTVGRVFGRAA